MVTSSRAVTSGLRKNIYNLDRICYRRFKLCCKVIFGSIFSDASLLFMLLLGLCLGQQLVIYNVGLIPSEFMEVLGEKDLQQFKVQLIKSFGLIIFIALCKSLVTLVSGYLYINWRRTLTCHLHKHYFYNNNFYFLNVLDKEVDNMDQRMTQDVDRFCQQLSTISAKVIISPLTIIYYSYQCFYSTGYIGPVVIYVYFLIGTVTNRLIMSSIVGLVYKQEKFEGDFRFKHTQIRANSESIAIMKSGKDEWRKTNSYFSNLLHIQKKIIHSELLLNFSTGLIDYIGSILSYVTIGLPIFAGTYDNMKPIALSSLISKNAFVSIYLISCFSTLIDLSSPITDICGYTHRIGELLEKFPVLKESQTEYSSVFKDDPDMEKDNIMQIENLSYGAPNSSELLLNNLNLIIKRNCNILVIGNTGTGKSSLIRILSSLWKSSSGIIKRSNFIKHIMFIPQQTVLTNGSLVDQIIYPQVKSLHNQSIILDNVEQALDNVGLTKLIERTGGLDNDPDWVWKDALSPGEIQRITFARLFFHQPDLAILDEATSALGVSEEECFYTYCRQLDISVVSIGHRDSLKQYHDVCLKLKGDGSWELFDL